MIAISALESGESRFLSALNASKEALESFVETFNRVLLDCPQMALYFGQGASSSQVARLLIVKERCARDLVARDPLGKGGVVDLAGVFKFALAAINKLFVSAKSKLESFDCGIFCISQLRAMPQSLSLLVGPGERLQCLISAFHLYHNRPIDNTEKLGSERDANARNSIALAHLHSASLHCPGRLVVPRRSATTSLQGISQYRNFTFINVEKSVGVFASQPCGMPLQFDE